MFQAVHIRAIAEAAEMLNFANGLAAITGDAHARCLELAKALPPSYRRDVRGAVTEGMTLDQIEKIFNDTFLSASWRLDLAGRDFCRAIVGAPTVNALLTPDALGRLTEINTPDREPNE